LKNLKKPKKQELKQKFEKVHQAEIFVGIKIKKTRKQRKTQSFKPFIWISTNGKVEAVVIKGYLTNLVGEKISGLELKTAPRRTNSVAAQLNVVNLL